MTHAEYTLNDGTPSFILTAEDGYDIVRKSDNFNFGNEIWLGYKYNKDGTKVLEVPEDFIEIKHVDEIIDVD